MKKIGNFLWSIIENIARFFLIKLFHIKFSEDAWNGLMQFIKFGIVGVSNTLIGYLIYVVSLNVFKLLGMFIGKEYFFAQIIMFLLSVLWSFYWNNKAVFKKEEGEKRNWVWALLKTYATYAFTSIFLSELLLFIEIEKLGWNDTVSPLLNLLITVPINFLIQKFWAFRKTRKE